MCDARDELEQENFCLARIDELLDALGLVRHGRLKSFRVYDEEALLRYVHHAQPCCLVQLPGRQVLVVEHVHEERLALVEEPHVGDNSDALALGHADIEGGVCPAQNADPKVRGVDGRVQGIEANNGVVRVALSWAAFPAAVWCESCTPPPLNSHGSHTLPVLLQQLLVLLCSLMAHGELRGRYCCLQQRRQLCAVALRGL
mmetsp:Transcript_107541/g.299590  ORF Transcript_107541/g.299590 Transcript_107541/m.299590 type:complete len:201 (+) Transcript_107541:637-1239(+)